MSVSVFVGGSEDGHFCIRKRVISPFITYYLIINDNRPYLMPPIEETNMLLLCKFTNNLLHSITKHILEE